MRLWEDGFDHYGTPGYTLDGSYATVGGNTLSTAHPATGNYGMYISTGPGSHNETSLRWVLPSAVDKLGVALRVYFDALPSGNSAATVVDFLTTDPIKPHVSVVIDANGAFRFYRGRNYFTTSGENGTLIATSDPLIGAGSQSHIEVQIYIHDTAGWVRVAINGVHRYQQTGLDTRVNADNIASISHSGSGIAGSLGSGPFYMDDYYIYDFTGDAAVDTDFCPTVDGSGVATNYIGDLQVWPLFPNGDTATAAWGKSSGVVGYNLINETPPDDTSYIYSAAAGDLSEFDLDDLPATITYIRGLGIHQRLSKSDGGAAFTKAGMKSVAATSDATERPLTVAATYWRDAIDVDPNSGARWTRSSLNAGKLRLTRSV